MKLRVRGNSLRLRLMQTEVEKIRLGEVVQETMHFSPMKKLVYTLEGSTQVAQIKADFEGETIRVMIPQPQALDWAGSQLVSISSKQTLQGNDFLKILIEKDFACLKPMNDEDDSDAFPHPEA